MAGAHATRRVPEHADAMGEVFRAAWGSLTSHADYREGTADWERETLLLRIIETAQAGKRDVNRLRDDALAHLANLRLQSGPSPAGLAVLRLRSRLRKRTNDQCESGGASGAVVQSSHQCATDARLIMLRLRSAQWHQHRVGVIVGSTAPMRPPNQPAMAPSIKTMAPNNAARETAFAAVSAACIACCFA
jgi:hypothetical protein